MKILNIKEHVYEELETKLRNVTLRNSDVKPYKDATIMLLPIQIKDIALCQYYILNKKLEKLRQLDKLLAKEGYEMFKLNYDCAYLTLTINNKEGDNTFDLLPIIVENWISDCICCDGAHRTMLAKQEGLKNPNVIWIADTPREYPYYAKPLPEDRVIFVDDVKEAIDKHGQKANYRRPQEMPKWVKSRDYRMLYRDFNSQFNNVSVSRGK